MSVVKFEGSLTVDGVDLGGGTGEGRLVIADLASVLQNAKMWAGIGARDIKDGSEPGYGTLTITEEGAAEPTYQVAGPGAFVIKTVQILTRAKRAGKGKPEIDEYDASDDSE